MTSANDLAKIPFGRINYIFCASDSISREGHKKMIYSKGRKTEVSDYLIESTKLEYFSISREQRINEETHCSVTYAY